VFCLPDVAETMNVNNRAHEMDCADIFVSLIETFDYKFDRFTRWDWRWTPEELIDIPVKNKIYYDRRAVIDGRVVFFENDKGTKDKEAVRAQVQRYKDLASAIPNEPFTVVFLAQAYRSTSAEARANMLYKLCDEIRLPRGSKFFVGMFDHFIANPLGDVLAAPGDPTKFVSFLPK